MLIIWKGNINNPSIEQWINQDFTLVFMFGFDISDRDDVILCSTFGWFLSCQPPYYGVMSSDLSVQGLEY